MPKRIMREFKIHEISAVDRPAQEGAQFAIIKRDEGKSKQNSKLADAIIKRYIDPTDGAVSFDTVLQEQLNSERYYEVCREIGFIISALDTSLRSIVADEAMASADKQTMMRSSVESFMVAIRDHWPDVEEALDKAFLSEGAKKEGNMPDVKDLEKQIAELTKQLDTTKQQLDAATTKDAAKKSADLQKQVDELTAKVAELTKTAEAEKTAAAEAAAKAELTDAEKAYLATLDKTAGKEWMDMKPEDRKKKMKKSEEEDETLTIAGRTIRKSAVGEDQFAIFKAQQEENEKLSKAVVEQTEKAENAEFTKRAEAELHHLPGEVTEKAAVLKSISKIADAKVRETLDKMLKAGEAAVKAGFNKVGHRNVEDLRKQESGAAGDFRKHVDEIASRDKISKGAAMQKARKEFPEAFKAYQEAGAEAGAANGGS